MTVKNPEVTAPGPVNQKVSVTPAIAMDYLARSDLNRYLSRDRAANLAAAFRRGEYRLTGDAIVFNKKNLMTNGQHRMLAVVIADLPYALDFWVMEGADDDEIMVQDTGRPRSFTDQLRINNVPNAAAISGAVKLLWNYEAGVIKDAKIWRGRHAPTIIQLDAFFKERESLVRDGIKHADRVRHTVPVAMSVLSTAWIVLSAIDKIDADGFWEELSMKSPASEPVNMLITQILRHSRSRKTSKGKESTGWYNTFDSRHQLALIIKTWNSYRSGNTPKNLIFRSGGATPELFPEPR